MRLAGKAGAGGKIAPARLKEWLEQGRVLAIDVRGTDEFRRGHIPGAVSIPLGELRRSLDGLPRDRPLVAVCLRGRRSARAARQFVKAGFAEVYNLAGGMLAWPYEVEEGGTGEG